MLPLYIQINYEYKKKCITNVNSDKYFDAALDYYCTWEIKPELTSINRLKLICNLFKNITGLGILLWKKETRQTCKIILFWIFRKN
jgi:hypothetical protein